MGDPHQEISRICSERGWLTLHTNDRVLGFLQRGASFKIEHPKGFFQPGVLAVTRAHRLLYRWRSVPSAENQQGALARPQPDYVWGELEKSLSGGDSAADAALDEEPEIDRAAAPRIIVLAMLVANGWFLSAKSMMYKPGKTMSGARVIVLLSRWLLFIVFWAVVFNTLPTMLAVVGLLGWVVWIVRDYRHYLSGFLSGRGYRGPPR